MITLQDNIVISLPINVLLWCFLSSVVPEVFFTMYAAK